MAASKSTVKRDLDLRLFELDVLAAHRVVLLQHQLVRRALLVLGGRVEVSGDGGRHQADELAAALLCHDVRPSLPRWAPEYATRVQPGQAVRADENRRFFGLF